MGLVLLVAAVLSGCTGRAVERFTLEVDLPAHFGLVGDASYTPAPGETC